MPKEIPTVVGNTLVIKVSNGITMTLHRKSNDYSDAQTVAEEMVAQYHPAETLVAWAVCEGQMLSEHVFHGTGLDADIEVVKKKDRLARTPIRPRGKGLAAIDDEDFIVVTGNPQARRPQP